MTSLIENAYAKQDPPGSGGYKWRALTTVSTGAFMGTMDFSITNISFPILTKVFQTELTTVVWVTLIYTLVCTSLMLLLGRMGDLIGRKRIYSTGVGVFTLGLFACAGAQGIGQLIFFRGVLAFGSAMMVSCGAAIVAEAFPPEETGRGLGLFGVAVSLGFITGPVLGGFLLDWLSWRSIFYVRAPIGLITMLLSFVLLKRDRVGKGPIRLDLMGAGLSSLGLFSMIFGVSRIRQAGTSSSAAIGMMAFGVVCMILFILTERRVREPLVDLSLFRNRTFSGAMLGLLLTFLAAPFYILIMPFYLMEGISLSASTAGLLMAVLSLTTIVSGPVSGWLSDRYGAAWFSTSGAWLIAVAFYLVRGFDLQTTVWGIIPVLVVMGLGVGTFQSPNNSTIMRATPRDHLGTASALIATSRHVGMTFGMALAGTIFAARRVFFQDDLVHRGAGAAYAAKMSIPLAFSEVVMISVVISLLIGLLSLLTGLPRKEKGEGGKGLEGGK